MTAAGRSIIAWATLVGCDEGIHGRKSDKGAVGVLSKVKGEVRLRVAKPRAIGCVINFRLLRNRHIWPITAVRSRLGRLVHLGVKAKVYSFTAPMHDRSPLRRKPLHKGRYLYVEVPRHACDTFDEGVHSGRGIPLGFGSGRGGWAGGNNNLKAYMGKQQPGKKTILFKSRVIIKRTVYRYHVFFEASTALKRVNCMACYIQTQGSRSFMRLHLFLAAKVVLSPPRLSRCVTYVKMHLGHNSTS